MKKKLLSFFVCCLVFSSCATNADREDILKSKNINEIEAYLSKAHSQDPKKRILKQKIIALKNSEWTKGAKDAKPMAARPVIFDLPSKSSFKKNTPESEAVFKKLLAETPEEHKQKTVKLLNSIFSQDISSNKVILLLKNNSDCNLVLEISGKKFYNLPIPAKSENSLVLEKDTYTLAGNLCDVPYTSVKEFSKGAVIILSNPETESPKKEMEKTATPKKKKSNSKTKKKK